MRERDIPNVSPVAIMCIYLISHDLKEAKDKLTGIPDANLSNTDNLSQDLVSLDLSVSESPKLSLTQAASIHQSSAPTKCVILALV
jgi:hypothetical protein